MALNFILLFCYLWGNTHWWILQNPNVCSLKGKSDLNFSICHFQTCLSICPSNFYSSCVLTKHTTHLLETDGFNFYYDLTQMESEIWKGYFHLYSNKLTLNLALWCLTLRYPAKTQLIVRIEIKTTNRMPQSINQGWGL